MPLSQFVYGEFLGPLIKEGTDLTEILGVVKYDPPIPACLSGISKGNYRKIGRVVDDCL